MIIDLGTLGGSFSESQGINDNCQVAGSGYPPGDGETHAFRWENGTLTDLGSLGAGGTQTGATDINNSGQVVGVSRTTEGEERLRLWKKALEFWPPYADYQKKTEREIPVFVLTRR